MSKIHEAKHHVSVKLDMDEMDLTSTESVSDDIKISGEEYVLFICNGNR